jgi:hypothetical protein
MASMKKPVKKSASTSNRVKPVSSAAKVRMADTKATKAANAKAPRYPRGMQGYGMSTSKGDARVFSTGLGMNKSGVTEVQSFGKGTPKQALKNARGIMKTVSNSKASGLKGTKRIIKGDMGYDGSRDQRFIYEYRTKAKKK